MNKKVAIDVHKIIASLNRTEEIYLTVVGDYSLDQYVYSNPKQDEPSVETALPAYQIHHVESYPGIGGTITNNLRSLGANVFCVGLLGDDGSGFELKRLLDKLGANTEYLISSEQVCTTVYMKPMRGIEKETSVEVNRLDFRNFKETPENLQKTLVKNLELAMKQSDGVIITDQFLEKNYSAITEFVREAIGRLALENKEKFFFVDSRGFVDRFENVFCKCNEHELEHILKENSLTKKQYLDLKQGNVFFVTEGEKGISIYENAHKIHIDGFKATPPLDICGAGDATNAGICLGLALGLSKEESSLLGCAVSSITIEQIGVTGSANMAQLKARLLETL